MDESRMGNADSDHVQKGREDSTRDEKIHSCPHMSCKVHKPRESVVAFSVNVRHGFPRPQMQKRGFKTGHRMYRQRNKNYFIQNVYSLYKGWYSACIKDNKSPTQA